MDSVVHFEITCEDVDRAKKFYQDIFDWKTQQMEGMNYVFANSAETDEQGQIKEKGRINGGMFERQGLFQSPILVMNVESIEQTMEKIKDQGGELVKEKEVVGDMGYTAYFRDTEGNILGLWEAM